MTSIQQEQARDRYLNSQRSDIQLEGPNTTGNLGINGFGVSTLYADFIFAEYIDMQNGVITTKGGIKVSQNQSKTWRKAKILMISPLVEQYGNTKVGDIVIFPNDKGLPTGTTNYVNAEGEVVEVKNGLFLNESRIFAKVVELEEDDS